MIGLQFFALLYIRTFPQCVFKSMLGPNCLSMIFRWDTIEHPTFGRVPRVVSLKEIQAGTELSVHYMINMEAAATDENSHCYWYVELWEEFSKCKKTLQSEETKELMDIADDIASKVNH